MNHSGVRDRLQVEQDKVGGGVLAPVQEQVVARDVHAVADRHETAEPEAAGLGRLQHGQPEGARLAEQATSSRPGDGPAEGGVEPCVGRYR